MHLGEMLDSVCSRYGGKKAIIFEDKTLSYSELQKAVNSLANHLKSLGIRKGDKVAIMLPNIPEFVISYFAILKLGAVAVTLNIMSTAYELQYLLGNSDSKAFITIAQSAKRYEEIKNEIPQCRHILLVDHESSSSPFMEAIGKGPFEFSMPPIDSDDPAVIVYTAGLTGNPHGAVLTHKNLFSQTTLFRDLFDGKPEDHGLAIIPLFHTFGATANMLGVMSLGCTVTILDQFNIDAILKAIERDHVTYIGAVPRVFLGMLLYEEADKFDTRSLRLCITGGSTMPPQYMPAFSKKFRCVLTEGYGLTEASPVCTVGRLNMPIKPGSIGVPIPGVEIKVIDDNDREVPAGQVGELVVRGINVMKGYYRDAEATAGVMKNGWLHTGDLARVDGEGYVFLTGRKKRMIITSGFNVYPREVEIILDRHPAVKASQVVGKPDLMRGEIVKALVVKRPNEAADERAILKHCRTYLSSYKVPREIVFIDSLN
ncbi:MAG TPA: AMP-binding protein [Syntrophales bacterium]|nr:AMP-binding protein [Syntrophales bacterium]HPI57413.1 AMP-binding protein [Syntrophales bacterium]HPN25477.1 AMP-binding protein [Syntrophales bacterium]HQM29959.1 AMP-binding protein [Syntrophales bacterium]